MDQAVSACISYLKESKNLSASTMDSYERDIRQYADYLKSLGIHEIRRAGREFIQSYIETLSGKGKSASTISRCIASLRVFYRFLIRNGLVEGNPILGIESPKVVRKPPKVLTEQEISKLLDIPGDSGIKNIRDKAIIELLCEAGLKVSELIALNVEHIDFDNAKLICSQGRRSREVPINTACLEGLGNYVVMSRPYLLKNSREKALFINSSGNRISRQGIWKIIKKYTRIAKIDTEVTPCILRQTLAAELMRKKREAGISSAMACTCLNSVNESI